MIVPKKGSKKLEAEFVELAYILIEDEYKSKPISAENFAEVVSASEKKKKKRKDFEVIRREVQVKLGYFAKVNSPSTILGREYVAISIRPLC